MHIEEILGTIMFKKWEGGWNLNGVLYVTQSSELSVPVDCENIHVCITILRATTNKTIQNNYPKIIQIIQHIIL